MTQPTVVFFGPDGFKFDDSKNKIYLRTLLYSTSKRGQVLESLHVSLQRGESKQNFNIWVYGENGNLKRGSGLFVPQEGITFDHHFVLPEDGADFKFLAGTYELSVVAKLVRDTIPKELMNLHLSISESQATQLTKLNTGIYFDWGPDQQDYYSHIGARPELEPKMEQLIELMNSRYREPMRETQD